MFFNTVIYLFLVSLGLWSPISGSAFSLGGLWSKPAATDKELKPLLQAYAALAQPDSKTSYYEEVMVRGYNLLKDNYVVPLTDQQKAQIVKVATQALRKEWSYLCREVSEHPRALTQEFKGFCSSKPNSTLEADEDQKHFRKGSPAPTQSAQAGGVSKVTASEVSAEKFAEKLILNEKNRLSATIVPYRAGYTWGELLMQATLKGMYESLDPHTQWLDKVEATALQNSIESEYTGLGLMLRASKKGPPPGLVEIVGLVPNTPASIAKMKVGDLIYKIQGKIYTSRDFLNIVEQLHQGSEEHPLSVTVLRANKEITFKVFPVIIKLPTVAYKEVPGGYGYIRINSFGESTAKELKRLLTSKALQKVKGLIIDVRNNPGGLLYSALEISDMFLQRGIIVSIKGRDTSHNKYYYASSHALVKPNLPVVILINNMSASAAEILTAALQQNGRAQVLGQRSFGKGSVQKAIALDAEGWGVITINLFYTPNSDALQGLGVVPNITIVPTVKNHFYDIRESEFKNYITVTQKHRVSKTNTLRARCCPVVAAFPDQEIGCAVAYLNGRLKYHSTIQ